MANTWVGRRDNVETDPHLPGTPSEGHTLGAATRDMVSWAQSDALDGNVHFSRPKYGWFCF